MERGTVSGVWTTRGSSNSRVCDERVVGKAYNTAVARRDSLSPAFSSREFSRFQVCSSVSYIEKESSVRPRGNENGKSDNYIEMVKLGRSGAVETELIAAEVRVENNGELINLLPERLKLTLKYNWRIQTVPSLIRSSARGRRGLINVPLGGEFKKNIYKKRKSVWYIRICIYMYKYFDPLASSFCSNQSLVAERGQEVTKFATTVVWSNPHRSPNVKWTPVAAPFRRCPTKHGPTPLPAPRTNFEQLRVCTRTELDNGNNLEFLLRVSRYVTSGNVDVGQVRPQRRPEHVKNGGSAINIRSQRAHVYLVAWKMNIYEPE